LHYTFKNIVLKNLYKLMLLLLSVTLFTSCAFNKVFLNPGKVNGKTNSFSYTSGNGTTETIVKLEGESYQPTLIKVGKDTMNFDFTIESVVFKSSNGNKLNGWLLKPKNQIPTITLLHFHGNSGFLFNQHQAISPLIKYGFQIFMFDYSGFGFSEGKATRENVLADANAALDYLKNRPEVKNTKLIIYGQSLGGHLAAVVGSQRQNDIDGLVIEGAFSSHKEMAGHVVPLFGNILVKQVYSAKKSIKKFNKPLLVIHSREDKIVPLFMSKKIFDKANQPKEFYEVDKYHIGALQFYSNEIATKIKRFLSVNQPILSLSLP
jgi:uncharacterized protein